jgi:hypothetical protein
MKRVEGDLWWKPFGTMLSCIDGKESQCHSNMTVEECERLCEQTRGCQVGYHLSFEEPYYNSSASKTICVPITNSYQWYNTQILNSLIDNKNRTKLSSNRGIRFTGFYNDKKYVSNAQLPKEFPTYLFSGIKVWLCTRDQEGTLYYLTDQLTFITVPDLAVTLNMIIAGSSIFDFKKRILRGSYLQFLQSNTYYCLTLQQKKFVWKQFQEFTIDSNNTFEINCPSQEDRWHFLNEEQEIHLRVFHRTDAFLQKDKKNYLVIGPFSPSTTFFFKIIPNDPYNQYFRRFFDSTLAHPPTPVFSDSLSAFLCNHYRSCQYSPLFSQNRKDLSFTFGILFLLSLDLLLLLVIVLKKKRS